MAINRETKKKVIEDWLSAFPKLTLFGQDKLYKVLGPLVVGLELIKLPRTEEYRPHFVLYPLWEESVKESLNIPILQREFYNKKGLQYSIPYESHRVLFWNVLESIRTQVPLNFETDISLKKLMSIIDGYSMLPPLSAAPNSYLQARLQAAKLGIALYVNKADAELILKQINGRNWDINHFKACGIDIGNWLRSLNERVENRQEFLRRIDTNKQDKKVVDLKFSELTT